MPPQVVPERQDHLASAPGVPDTFLECADRCPIPGWPGSLWPDPGSGRRAQAAATAPPWLAILWSGAGSTALKLGAIFSSPHPSNRVADLRDAIVQTQTGSFQWRTSIIGQGGSHGQAVVSDRVIFRRGVLFQGSFNGSHPAQLLLQERFGMLIGFIERLDGIFEIMKLTELMRDI